MQGVADITCKRELKRNKHSRRIQQNSMLSYRDGQEGRIGTTFKDGPDNKPQKREVSNLTSILFISMMVN